MRYSQLGPLSIDEQAAICKMLVNFFGALNTNSIKKEMQIETTTNTITPLSLHDFFTYYKDRGYDLYPKMHHVKAIIQKLVSAQILSSRGGVDFNERFFGMFELSSLQRQGWLWLGRALTSPYIANEIAKDIVYIEGKTRNGDVAIGTGILISRNEILTCAHVINDLSEISEIKIHGQIVFKDSAVAHPKIDVGIIRIKSSIDRKLPDLAFRDAVILEEVLIAGYPSVPGSLLAAMTFQRGEICGHLPETLEAWPMDLFSAVARPGNSGGPVVAMDGRIVGIVTRSLERQKEEADAMAPMPFFAAVPSKVIARALSELNGAATRLPWEDWN